MAKNVLVTFEVDKHRFMVERFLNESSVLFLHGKIGGPFSDCDLLRIIHFHSAENNLMCDCRLLWLYDLRNRTRSGIIQKALDNLNCDLKEREFEKAEQVYLLRLHYENFDCKHTVVPTEESRNLQRAVHPANNLHSAAMINQNRGSIHISFLLFIICLLFCK